MADRNFSELAARIEPQVRGAPRPLVIDHIRQAARLQARKTLAWRYQIPLFDLLPGVHEYAFNVPEGTEIAGVFAVFVNNCPLDLLTLRGAFARYPEWATLYSGEDAEEVWSETPGGYLGAGEYNETVFNEGSTFVLPDSIVAAASSPKACVMLTPQRYIILPLPDGDETYTVRMFVALRPTNTATAMDEQALNEMEDAIVHKALSTLMLIRGTKWYNVNLASIHEKFAKDERLEVRASAEIGKVGGSLSVQMRPWA